MAIELHVSGPGIDTRRLLREGEAELTLGRDADCDICLPDPVRNVSRRHLALHLLDGEVHFHVTSVVNGVELPFGEAPPGARGVWPLGQVLKLADYQLMAAPVAEAPATADDSDPWAVFDRDPSGIAPVPAGLRAPAAQAAAPVPAEDDPFGDWGFESTFGPGSRAGSALDMTGAGTLAQDLSSFFRGLGLDPRKVGPLSPGELEGVGRIVRQAVQGLLALYVARRAAKSEAHTEDRTLLPGLRHENPLQRDDWSLETRLQYLLGGRSASVGFIHPERALEGMLDELRTHDLVTDAATRAAVQGVLREMSPQVLRQALLGDGPALFEGARMWAAFVRHYEEQAEDMPGWVQRIFDKYFTETYVQELVRLQAEAEDPSH